MSIPRARIAPLVVLALLGCKPSAPAKTATPAEPSPAKAPAPLDTLERVLGGAPADARLPTIIALHGLGDRPEGFVHLFDGFDKPARLVVPRAPLPAGEGARWFPAEVGARDPVALAEGITSAVGPVLALIDRLEASGRMMGKPILTGFSQGGMVTLAVAVAHPSRVGYALPVGGLLPPPLWPAAKTGARYPPIRALHGRDDRIVPFGLSSQGIRALRELGVDATLLPFERVGHRIPPPMRDELYRMLAAALERTFAAAQTSSAAAGRRAPPTNAPARAAPGETPSR